MPRLSFLAYLCFLAAACQRSQAFPMFDYGVRDWDSDTSATLVRPVLKVENDGDLYLSAKGSPSWLASNTAPGLPGDVIITSEHGAPFYVHNGLLYQVQNTTSILFANVLNITDPSTTKVSTEAPTPVQVPIARSALNYRRPSFKIRLATERGGVPGEWSWNSTDSTLRYTTRGATQTKGAFYSCTDRSGTNGVYVDLDDSAKYTVGCAPVMFVEG